MRLRGETALILAAGAILGVVLGAAVAMPKLGDVDAFTPRRTSMEDVEAEAALHPRVYPAAVKGTWDPSPARVERVLESDADALGALGVNTVTIIVAHEYVDGTLQLKETIPRGFDDAKHYHAWLVTEARKAGFAVLLAPTVSVDGNAPVPLDVFLEDSRRIALEYAALAGRLNVEYYDPQDAFDGAVAAGRFIGDDATDADVVRVSNEWRSAVNEQVRGLYHGKIVCKMAIVSPGHEAPGCSLVGFALSPGDAPPAEFAARVRDAYAHSAVVASLSGAQGWLVAEFRAPVGDLQDDHYAVATREYAAFDGYVTPKGFVFSAHAADGTDVAGRPAEAVLAEFLATLG